MRGVEGYQLPKWLIDIEADISGEEVLALASAPDGRVDLGQRVETPPPLPGFGGATR
ncbi:hypothetical protein C725_2960 [Pacificimonas flava]|uniref:Uncharacterized protein n=1 Tax=Pacificimonas flava TaxID=1234595 RepID=M2TJ59_9SPHN|nr:hypothetical protein C725_2960 [Pacificimonas flava]